MAVKNEFVACLQTVEECILICRPRNPAAFIVQYLQDEYEMNSDGAESIDSVSCHMLHMLPFVYKDVMLFREYCSILFLNLMEKYRLGGIEPLIPISCLEAVFSGLTLRAHWEQNQIINDVSKHFLTYFFFVKKSFIYRYLKWILAKMPSDSVNFSQMTGIMQNFIQENIAYNFVKILFLHVLRKISQYPLSQSNSYQVDVAALRSILLKYVIFFYN